jgi:hypothetical protein
MPPPPPGTPGAALGIQAPQHLQDILLTIRLVESGQRYQVPPNRGNASGAYQYIASTWNDYAGYPHAYLAPAHIQDQRALTDVQGILATWRGDVSMVPVIWYYPAAARNAALLDQVPMPGAGNRLTVREYQRRWLDVLAYITGTPSFFRPHAIPPDLEFISGRPPVLTTTADSDVLFVADAHETPAPIAFPVLGHTVITPPIPCDYDHCTSGTDATVFGLKLQPVLAAVDGVITSVQLDDPATGSVGLTLTARDGRRFVYTGLNDDSPGTNDGLAPDSLRVSTLGRVGATVYAGQILGYMGDSDPMPGNSVVKAGEAVWPHITLTGYAADGSPLDTDLLVMQAQRRQACHVGIGPWSVPADPAADPSRDDADVDAVLNGKWTVHADGRVTAEGRSTLIMPPEGCIWAPTDRFGPGAAGNTPPFLWGVPFGIPSEMWVADALDRGLLDATTPMLG